MKSLHGQLLVASPHLPDPNFFRTVVLLVQHHDQGALGLVLNRPSPSTVSEIIAKVSDVQCAASQPVGVGGPIQGPLMAVHRHAPCSEAEVFPGVYFATQREHILEIVQKEEREYRLFSGYAGWGGGQLEGELEVGGWLTIPGSLEYVFGTAADELWKKVTQKIGDQIINSAFKIRHVPDDPSAN